MGKTPSKPKKGREYDAKKRAKQTGQANPEADRVADEMRERIAAEFGEPYLFREGRGGEMRLAKLNGLPLAAVFAETSPGILYEIDEGQFYGYQAETGLWRPRSDAQTLVDVARFMLDESRRPGMEELAEKQSQKQELGIIGYLRGLPKVAHRGVFGFRPERRNRVIHLANGVLEVKDNRLAGFRPDFRKDDFSRNRIPVGYDPKAKCPRFLEELLGPSLPDETRDDDIRLLAMFFGLFLLGINLPQKMLILDGAPGSGKSTIAKIAGLLVGEENRANLRTEHLAGRFELAAFVGKTLLMASDVKQRFLLENGAQALKSLTGGDMLEAEPKHGGRIPIQGCYNVVITANSQLRLKIENDRGAWFRRLAIITFREHSPARKIAQFENQLFREEGAGILNFAIDGLVCLLDAMAETGEMPLTDAQLGRVESMLSQSEGLEAFLRDRVERAPECKLTKAEIREAFWDYCRENHWDLPGKNEIGSRLPGAMKRLFGVAESHSIPDGGKEVYGYAGVGWKAVVD